MDAATIALIFGGIRSLINIADKLGRGDALTAEEQAEIDRLAKKAHDDLQATP
jgi:hypothetical protein